MPEEASKRQRLWWRCDEANRPAGARAVTMATVRPP